MDLTSRSRGNRGRSQASDPYLAESSLASSLKSALIPVKSAAGAQSRIDVQSSGRKNPKKPVSLSQSHLPLALGGIQRQYDQQGSHLQRLQQLDTQPDWIPYGALKELERSRAAANAKKDPYLATDVPAVRALEGELDSKLNLARGRGPETSHVIAQLREQQWLKYRQILNKFRADKFELNTTFSKIKVQQACTSIKSAIAQVDAELDDLLVRDGALVPLPLPPEGRVSAAARIAISSLESKIASLEQQISLTEQKINDANNKLKLHAEAVKQKVQFEAALSAAASPPTSSQSRRGGTSNRDSHSNAANATAAAALANLQQLQQSLQDSNILSQAEQSKLNQSIAHYTSCVNAWRPVLQRAQAHLEEKRRELEEMLKEELDDAKKQAAAAKNAASEFDPLEHTHDKDALYESLLKKRAELVMELESKLRSLEAERQTQMLRLLDVTEARLRQTHYDSGDLLGSSVFSEFLTEERAEQQLSQLQNLAAFNSLITRLQSDSLQRVAWTNYARARAIERLELERGRSLFLGVLRFALSPMWLLPRSRQALYDKLAETLMSARAVASRGIIKMLSLTPPASISTEANSSGTNHATQELDSSLLNVDSSILTPGPNTLDELQQLEKQQGKQATSRAVPAQRRLSISQIHNNLQSHASPTALQAFIPCSDIASNLRNGFKQLTSSTDCVIDVDISDLLHGMSENMANLQALGKLDYDGLMLCQNDVSALASRVSKVCAAVDSVAHQVLSALYELESRRSGAREFLLDELKKELAALRDNATSPTTRKVAGFIYESVESKLLPLFRAEEQVSRDILSQICERVDEEIELFAAQADALGRFALAIASAWEGALLSFQRCEAHFAEALCMAHDLYAERVYELLKVTESHIAAASEADSLESLQLELQALRRFLVSTSEDGLSIWEATHRLWQSRVQTLSEDHVTTILAVGNRALSFLGQLLGVRAKPLHQALVTAAQMASDVEELRLDFARRDAELEGLVRLQLMNTAPAPQSGSSTTGRRTNRANPTTARSTPGTALNDPLRGDGSSAHVGSADNQHKLLGSRDENDISAELAALGVTECSSTLPPLPSLDSIRGLGLSEQLTRVRALRALLTRHVESRLAALTELVKNKPILRIAPFEDKQERAADGDDAESLPQDGEGMGHSNAFTGTQHRVEFENMEFYRIESDDAMISRMLGLSLDQIRTHITRRDYLLETVRERNRKAEERANRESELAKLHEAVDAARREVEKIDADIAALPTQNQIGAKFAALQRLRAAANTTLTNAVAALKAFESTTPDPDQASPRDSSSQLPAHLRDRWVSPAAYSAWLGVWKVAPIGSEVPSDEAQLLQDIEKYSQISIVSRFEPHTLARMAATKGASTTSLIEVASKAFLAYVELMSAEQDDRSQPQVTEQSTPESGASDLVLVKLFGEQSGDANETSERSLEVSESFFALSNTFSQVPIPFLYHARAQLAEIILPTRSNLLLQLLSIAKSYYDRANELKERRIAASRAVLVGALEQLRPAMTWITRHVIEPRSALLSKRLKALERLDARATEAAKEADQEMHSLCETALRKIELWAGREADEAARIRSTDNRAALSSVHVQLRSETTAFEADYQSLLKAIRERLHRAQSHITAIGDNFLKTCVQFMPRFEVEEDGRNVSRKLLLDSDAHYVEVASKLVPSRVELALNQSRFLEHKAPSFKHLFPPLESNLPAIPCVQETQKPATVLPSDEQSLTQLVVANPVAIDTLVPFGTSRRNFDLSSPFGHLMNKHSSQDMNVGKSSAMPAVAERSDPDSGDVVELTKSASTNALHPREFARVCEFVKATIERAGGSLVQLYDRRLHELESLLQQRVASIEAARNELVNSRSSELARAHGSGKLFGPARRILDASVKQLLARDENEQCALAELLNALSEIVDKVEHDESGSMEEATSAERQKSTMLSTHPVDRALAIAASNSAIGLARLMKERLPGPPRLSQPKPKLKPALAEVLKSRSARPGPEHQSSTAEGTHAQTQAINYALLRETLFQRDHLVVGSAHKASEIVRKLIDSLPPRTLVVNDGVPASSSENQIVDSTSSGVLESKSDIDVFLGEMQQVLLGEPSNTTGAIHHQMFSAVSRFIEACGLTNNPQQATGPLGLPHNASPTSRSIQEHGNEGDSRLVLADAAYGLPTSRIDPESETYIVDYTETTIAQITTLLSAIRSLAETRIVRLQLVKDAVRSDEALRPLLSRLGDLKSVDVRPLAEFILAVALFEATKQQKAKDTRTRASHDHEDASDPSDEECADWDSPSGRYSGPKQGQLGVIPCHSHPVSIAFVMGAVAGSLGGARALPSPVLRTTLGHIRALCSLVVQRRYGVSEGLKKLTSYVSAALNDLKQNGTQAAEPPTTLPSKDAPTSQPGQTFGSRSTLDLQHRLGHQSTQAQDQAKTAPLPILVTPEDTEAAQRIVTQVLEHKGLSPSTASQVSLSAGHSSSHPPGPTHSRLNSTSFSMAPSGSASAAAAAAAAASITAADPVVQRLCLSLSFVNAQLKNLISGTMFGSSNSFPKDIALSQGMRDALEISVRASHIAIGSNANERSEPRPHTSQRTEEAPSAISRAAASAATVQIANLLGVIIRFVLLLIPPIETVQQAYQGTIRGLRASALAALAACNYLSLGRQPPVPLVVRTQPFPKILLSLPAGAESSSGQQFVTIQPALMQAISQLLGARKYEAMSEAQCQLVAKFRKLAQQQWNLLNSIEKVAIELPPPPLVGVADQDTPTTLVTLLDSKWVPVMPPADAVLELATASIFVSDQVEEGTQVTTKERKQSQQQQTQAQMSVQTQGQNDQQQQQANLRRPSADSTDPFEEPIVPWKSLDAQLSLQEDVLGALIYFKAEMVARLASHRLAIRAQAGEKSPEDLLQEPPAEFMSFATQIAETVLERLFSARQVFVDQLNALHDLLPKVVAAAFIDLNRVSSHEAHVARHALSRALDAACLESERELQEHRQLVSQLAAHRPDNGDLSKLDSMERGRSAKALKVASTFRTSALVVELILLRSVFQRTLHLSSSLTALVDSLVHPADLISVPSNPGPTTTKLMKTRPSSSVEAMSADWSATLPSALTSQQTATDLTTTSQANLTSGVNPVGTLQSTAKSTLLELPAIRGSKRVDPPKSDAVVARNQLRLRLLRSKQMAPLSVPKSSTHSTEPAESALPTTTITTTTTTGNATPMGHSRGLNASPTASSGQTQSLTSPLSARGTAGNLSSAAAAAAAAQAARESAQSAFQSALQQASVPLSFFAVMENTLQSIMGSQPEGSGHSDSLSASQRTSRLIVTSFPGVQMNVFKLCADSKALEVLLRGVERGALTPAATNALLRDIEAANCPVTQLFAHVLLAEPGRTQTLTSGAVTAFKSGYAGDEDLSIQGLLQGKAEAMEVKSASTYAYRSALSRMIFTRRDAILREVLIEHQRRVDEIEDIVRGLRESEDVRASEWSDLTAHLRVD